MRYSCWNYHQLAHVISRNAQLHSVLMLTLFHCSAILGNQKKHSFQMPVVNEHQSIDPNRAGTSRNDGQFANRHVKNFRSHRKSEVPSPELIWQVSEMFLCLDSLGASVAKDSAPYDRMSYAENSFDRVRFIFYPQWMIRMANHIYLSYQPLSEMSLDVGDGVPYGSGALMTSSIASNTNALSKFHRSISMGQGWSGQALANRYSIQPDENFETKVVMRRKNNKICDTGEWNSPLRLF